MGAGGKKAVPLSSDFPFSSTNEEGETIVLELQNPPVRAYLNYELISKQFVDIRNPCPAGVRQIFLTPEVLAAIKAAALFAPSATDLSHIASELGTFKRYAAKGIMTGYTEFTGLQEFHQISKEQMRAAYMTSASDSLVEFEGQPAEWTTLRAELWESTKEEIKRGEARVELNEEKKAARKVGQKRKSRSISGGRGQDEDEDSDSEDENFNEDDLDGEEEDEANPNGAGGGTP